MALQAKLPEEVALTIMYEELEGAPMGLPIEEELVGGAVQHFLHLCLTGYVELFTRARGNHRRRDSHFQILSGCERRGRRIATSGNNTQCYQHHMCTVVVIQCTHLDTTICTAIPCSVQVNKLGKNILHHCMCYLSEHVLCTGLLKCSHSIHAEDPDCMTYMLA